MRRIRTILADLALIPPAWRYVAARTREQLARDAEKAAWEATPAHKALVAKYGEGYRFSGFGIYRALAELGFSGEGAPL